MGDRSNNVSDRVDVGWTGPLTERGDAVAAAALRQGATPLMGAVLGDAASLPDWDWRTSTRIVKDLEAATGKKHHPGSIRRIYRDPRFQRFCDQRRVMPLHKPLARSAKYISPHGTMEKRVRFEALRIKDPVSQHERRRLRKHSKYRGKYADVAVAADDPRVLAPTRHGEPRYSTPPRPVPPPPVPPEIAAMAASAMAAIEQREALLEQTEDAAMVESVLKHGHPP